MSIKCDIRNCFDTANNGAYIETEDKDGNKGEVVVKYCRRHWHKLKGNFKIIREVR